MFFGLSNNVGNGLANKEEDVLFVKQGLSDAGFMDISEDPEPHGFMTRHMDDAIKGFQKDNNLRVDGKLFSSGETFTQLNKGISQGFLNDIRKRSPELNLPSKPTDLTNQQITSLFREEFFERTQINKLNEVAGFDKTGSKLVEHVFDANVMTNPIKVGVWLQEAIDETIGTDLRADPNNKEEPYDGILGSQTRKAIKQAVEQGKVREISKSFADKRIKFLRGLENYSNNKNGWEKRVMELRD